MLASIIGAKQSGAGPRGHFSVLFVVEPQNENGKKRSFPTRYEFKAFTDSLAIV